jgi:hypothetical protein
MCATYNVGLSRGKQSLARRTGLLTVTLSRACDVEQRINELDLKKRGVYTREHDPKQSTQFTYARFYLPYLQNYKGWTYFCDDDFLWLGDIKVRVCVRPPCEYCRLSVAACVRATCSTIRKCVQFNKFQGGGRSLYSYSTERNVRIACRMSHSRFPFPLAARRAPCRRVDSKAAPFTHPCPHTGYGGPD